MITITGPKYTNEFIFIYVDRDFKPLKVSPAEIKNLNLDVAEDACFYFLRYGFVPPPLTIYSNLICLPVGLDASFDLKNKSIKFIDNFRFVAHRSSQNSKPDLCILKKEIHQSVQKCLSSSCENILMQSGGKDSTVLVEALSQFKDSHDISCMTYEASFRDQESAVAQSISHHYGIDHQIITPNYGLEFSLLAEHYAMQNPILSADCTLPAYLHSLSKFRGANVIDGLGNDMYMGYIGTKVEIFLEYFNLSWLQKYEPSKFTNNEFINYGINTIFMTSKERMFPGTKLSVKEINKITGLKYEKYFSDFISKTTKNFDIDDSKASIRARFCDYALFQTKGLQSAMYSGNIIKFPFGEKEIFEYYFGLPQNLRYSKKKRTNKIFLRTLLESFDVDKSFIYNKSGFRYDMEAFIKYNTNEIRKVLTNSKFFEGGLDYFLSLHLDRINYTSASKIYILLSFALWMKSNESKTRVKHHIASNFFKNRS
jgi:asparagine synthase (glutamine-hydrolysing)